MDATPHDQGTGGANRQNSRWSSAASDTCRDVPRRGFRLPGCIDRGDESEKWTDATLPSQLVYEAFERRAALFRWPANAKLPSTGSVAEFRASVAEAGLTLPDTDKHVLVVQESRLLGFYLNGNNDGVTSMSVIEPEEQHARLDQEHASLVSRRVGIIGCGSLGSKFATICSVWRGKIPAGGRRCSHCRQSRAS